MTKRVFERFDGHELTDDMLRDAVHLFNDNYGIWGDVPGSGHEPGKPRRKKPDPVSDLLMIVGSRVKLSKSRLRDLYLPKNASCSYVKVTADDRLAGNALACRWSCKGKSVCWVTQLVVHHDFRERGLAAGLLNALRQDGDDVYGLMSSHPAACLAAAKAFGSIRSPSPPSSSRAEHLNTGSIHTVVPEFIRDNAEVILDASPISYVRDAKLRGSLFDPTDTSGVVSSVDTDFFVDHAEPLKALAWIREGLDWPLGELHDGHEFLILLARRRRG